MRHLLVPVLSLAMALTATTTYAGSYPDRPIRLVVGFGVGGPTDIPARFIAEKLSQSLGQRVFVENKPASGGIVATRDVIARPADGYTLLLCTHFDSINVAAYKDPGFKLSDLAPISLIATILLWPRRIERRSSNRYPLLHRLCKAHPSQVNYGTVGYGSAQEILARQLQNFTGITMTQVPFRGGAEPVQELIAGRIQFYVAPPLAFLPHYRNKELKIIAVTSSQRLNALPDVPTLTEDGIDFVRSGWLGVCAPAGTPAPIIQTLNRDITSIVGSNDYRGLIENSGSIAESSTPAGLETIMQQTLTEVAPTIAEFHLQRE